MYSEKSDSLNQSIKYLKSVGPKRAESFSRVGINTIRDLLFYFPSRYLDRSNILTTAKLYEYIINGYDGEVTILGKVLDREIIRYSRKEILKVQLKDSTGYFECAWFQGIKYFQNLFLKDEYYAISAKPVLHKYGNIMFAHPDFDKISDDESQLFLNTGKIIPFYRVSKDLRATNLGDFSLRRIIHSAVEKFSGDLPESLSEEIINANNLMDINKAVRNVHFPENFQILNSSMQRFKFEELFFLEMILAFRRNRIKTGLTASQIKVETNLIQRFLKTLPFKLTGSQLKVLTEIRKDMESGQPMNRLLQGDVGSGKTIVALITLLIVKDNGYQCAFMVPTEILASQHYNNFKRMLKDFNIKVSLLVGGQKKSERNIVLKEIEEGESDIIIGTHALLEENVVFRQLGVIIVDEQHRFGVVQRSKLIRKGKTPHVLIMTATPIPRTLTMTIYGDLDISVINELPSGRKQIKTLLRGESKLPRIYDFISTKEKEGYRSLIVFPLVKESEKLDLKAAEIFYKELKDNIFSDLNVGMVHGKMSWNLKESAMQDFAAGKINILVATTVVEVGIDVPEANIIVINDAHRFGLSQLHQLRGRIGRSNIQAYCILVTKDEFVERSLKKNLDVEYLSSVQKEKSRAIIRMQAMVNNTDGFEISEIDLKLRGPGNIFGTEQSGFPDLKYADIIKDHELLVKAKQAAFKIVEDDPKLILPCNKIIRSTLLNNYKPNFNYITVA